ncbi:MAG: ABC transporter [Candidatus Cloacimonetes bacterium 4572_55]|nr:MAG: ABC transporter [Candidatus Cloacimonetes bacterium 4572_55]
MSNILTILKKEFKSYFNSAIAYIFITVFLLITGWFFVSDLFLANQASLRGPLSIIPLIFIFFIPGISMRLISEERKSGTIELLVTMPVKDHEIILGKYFAALALLFAAVLSTFPYVMTISILGEVDGGVIFGQYLGMLLMGAAYLAIGTFASSMTRNQIVAFITSFLLVFIFFLIGKMLVFLPTSLVAIAEYISIDFHFENLVRGVVDSRDMIYYFSLISFFLLLSFRALGSRKWK